MRKFLAVAGLIGVSLCAQTTAPLRTAVEARAEIERLRPLVDAGAIPRAQLEKAEQEIAESEDDQVLKRTLYAHIEIGDLDGQQMNEMLAAAQRKVDRQQQKVNKIKDLVDAGVTARIALTPLLEELDMRRREYDLAVSHARLAEDLSRMAQAEEAAMENDLPSPSPMYASHLRYDGRGVFTTFEFEQVSGAFEKHFGRKLPVSAFGMTAIHRALGFDHRGRVDVALSPDQEDGQWLRAYLEQNQIPYFAFRTAIPGKATAPHIHLGPPSLRLRSAD